MGEPRDPDLDPEKLSDPPMLAFDLIAKAAAVLGMPALSWGLGFTGEHIRGCLAWP